MLLNIRSVIILLAASCFVGCGNSEQAAAPNSGGGPSSPEASSTSTPTAAEQQTAVEDSSQPGATEPESTLASQSAADPQRDSQLVQGEWVSTDDRVFPFSQSVLFADVPEDIGVPELAGKHLHVATERFTYKLDPTQAPKTIDLTSERDGKKVKGIYEFKGNLLLLAINLDGESRPTTYTLSEQDKANDKQGKSTKWAFELRRKAE